MVNAAEKGGSYVPPPPKPPSTKVVVQPGSKILHTQPRKKKTTVSRSRSSTPRRSSSNYRSSSSSHRSNAVARRATKPRSTRRATPVTPPPVPPKVIKPVAPPKPPGIATSLRSDATYQKQMAAYAKALADFQADQTLQRGDYETGYQNTYRDIGLAKEDALENLENDYAARGLLRSSLYNTDVGKLTQEYQNQYNDLSKQRTNFLDQLVQGLTGFKNEQSVQQQNAMDEALRRRAERYNL